MTRYAVSGIVSHAALELARTEAIDVLRQNIAAQLLAAESGRPLSQQVRLIDPYGPLDARIRWAETSEEYGYMITGTLDTADRTDLAKLLLEHSATKLLHEPTRHVCAGCGQPITGTMADHQADVLELAGYALPAPKRPAPTTEAELDDDKALAADQLAELVLDWMALPSQDTAEGDADELAQMILTNEWVPGWAYRRDVKMIADAAHAAGHEHELERVDEELDSAWRIANYLNRLHEKTGTRLRAARALIRDQRETIAAQDALIDGMRNKLTQRRAVKESEAALS